MDDTKEYHLHVITPINIEGGKTGGSICLCDLFFVRERMLQA